MPPRDVLQSPARKRAMHPSKTTIVELISLANVQEDLGIGSIILDGDDNVRAVNGVASALLGISQEPEGRIPLVHCIDPMSAKSRILREIRDHGAAYQVPTKIHTGLTGSSSSDWLVTIKQHLDMEGNPLARSVTLIENAETAALAGTDALTGLPNRRTFTHELHREHGMCQRHREPLSLLYIDVDRFKRFNDEHGHDAGDAVLAAVAQCLEITVRTTDLACRLGGEEFAVILPRTSEEGAQILAEKLRATVEERVVDFLGEPLSVTISVGVSTYVLGDRTTVDGLITHADHAMLRAKESGRNRVCISEAA